MKLKFFTIVYLSFCLVSSCVNKTKIKVNQKLKDSISFEISNELGYLTKKEGLSILNQSKMSNQNDKGWDFVKENDTIGKYFQSKKTGNFIFCIIDLQDEFDFETHVLIELKKTTKNSFEIVAKERYFHGNYSCCWSNYYDGFNKIDDYFTFNYCGTGSGFCGTGTYYFKNVIPQDNLKEIPDNYSNSDGSSILTLSSKKELNNNILIYHYEFEKFEIKGEDELISKEVDNFSIIYELKNNTWFCNDKKLERLAF